MPMFYTPKPRKFHYQPRFFDPEKEEWEKLKTKYRLQEGLPLADTPQQQQPASDNDNNDSDLAYFQRKVRDIDRQERLEKQKISLADLFRRREKPTFHYTSRFDADGNIVDTPATATQRNEAKRRITRRFENDDDFDRFKPVPAGKIMIYTLIVFMLLFFIFNF